MMLPHDVASMLEQFAIDVERIRGISRNNPHQFVEDKSEVVGAMRAKAKELRTVPVEPLPMLRPGAVDVGRRSVRVEVRGRRRA